MLHSGVSPAIRIPSSTLELIDSNSASIAQDIRYDAIGCISLALRSAIQARKNADTYELFALGRTFLHDFHWDLGTVLTFS